MATKFKFSGGGYYPASERTLKLEDKLPLATYTIKIDQFDNLYYEQIDNLSVPSKLYGDISKNTDRIINTFNERPSATGVLLSGEKGSGKTLLAKNLSVELMKNGIATVIINTPLCGEKFNTFIQLLEQPALILFDEFEKVYDKESQEKVLTLLDGVYPTKKLFVVTSNDKWRIDENMRNRPGRLFYMLEYEGLSREFIQEYALDTLTDTSKLASILTIATLFKQFNFDMLKALVEEMNRYNETAQEAMKILNTKPDGRNNTDNFDLVLMIGGVDQKDYVSATWCGNPLSQIVCVEWEDDSRPDDDSYTSYSFRSEHLKKIDGEAGTFIFENDEKAVLKLTRKKVEEFSWSKLI